MARSQNKRRILYVDSDSEARNLPDGACRHLLNSRTFVTDEASSGASENVKSNVLINNPNLPAGNNTTIGSCQDKEGNTIIYCVYNDQGNHGIFRYYPDNNNAIETILVDPALNFNKNSKITGANVIGDLFYWTDNNVSPRKINLQKANNTGKFFQNNVYLFPEMVLNAIGYTITINKNGVITIVTLTIPVGASITPELQALLVNQEGYAIDLANRINADPTLQTFFTADSCGIFVTLTNINAEENLIIDIKTTLSNPPSDVTLKVVAENYYPSPFKEEFIERVKYPFECEPVVTVKQDPTRVANLLENKVFQFRAQIYYDDYEKSAWGPVSIIPDVPLNCNQATSQNTYNYVEVNFDFARFNDLASLSIIRGVNIAVRELNTGDWKLVTQLSKAQFLANGNIYKFYNDVIPETLDSADAAKWFDAVGLKVKSQEIVNDRIFDGGIVEGYDNVCVDAQLGLTYEQDVKQDTFSISGKIFIRNPFASQQEYMAHQPIHNNGTGIGFGGFAPLDYENDYLTDYNQALPLGGFIMYLAGTPYYGVSQQIQGNNPQIQTNGVYDSSNAGVFGNANRQLIRDEITGNGNSNDAPFPQTRVWSEYTIPNVPPGKYILRIASHLTTQADLDSGNLNWQRSSTNVLGVGGVISTECLLEVKSNGDIVISGVTYPAGTQIPNTAVADLTAPQLSFSSTAISGYVCDNDGAPTILDDTRIELTRVVLTQTNGGYNSIPSYYNLSTTWAIGNSYTDHNGYFFYANSRDITIIGNPLDIDNIYCAPTNTGTAALTPTKLDINGGAWNPSNSPKMTVGIFRNTSSGIRDNYRTIIQGNISYSGKGIQDISIICSRGRVDSTDAAGNFNLFAYTDSRVAPIREDYLFYGLQDTCIATFSQNRDYFNIAISSAGAPQTMFVSPYSGNYNQANPLTVVDVTITGISSGTSTSSFKRGGKFNLGLVYLDQANRNNFVGTSEALRLQIPFYTQQQGGVIVGAGKPIVSWQIKHLPPDWATHYQWVRTVNGNQGKFLQWTAKSIVYVDDNGNVVGSYTAGTQIQISIESILTYKDDHIDSQVSYQFEEGDRIVFIKDANGNFFGDYFDLKIKGVKTNPLIIYVDNLVAMGQILEGALVEIYNPNKDLEEQFYYEFGECFEIGETNGIKYHKGLTQDQSPTNPSGVPATGVFRNGDVWIRTRTIKYGSTGGVKTWTIEDRSISDFYPSLSSSIGRPHIVNKESGQLVRPSLIRFSNRFIPGTRVNGLSSFEALNEKILPQPYGYINKLIESKDVLLAIFQNSETVSMYVGKAILNDLSGQNLVAISEKVISDTYEYQGSLGTQNPESVDIDQNGNVFGFDVDKGVVWKRTNNGLEPISEADNRTYFRNKSNQIRTTTINTWIPAVHDRSHSQYLISFFFDAPDESISGFSDESSTFAYSDEGKKWESFYIFVPEYYGKSRNNIYVSFVNGILYRHEAGTTYNNFYGQQSAIKITTILNMAPSDMKGWLSMALETNKRWSAPSIKTPSGQESELADTDFELIENVYYADLLKDQNTPNVSNPLIFGDDLLGETLEVTLSNSDPTYTRIYAVNTTFILSQSTNK